MASVSHKSHGHSRLNGYIDDGQETPPIGGYMVLNGVFVSLVVAIFRLVARRRAGRVGDPQPHDLLLVAIATHRVARTLAKDKVTAYLRAPFTRRTGPGEPGEVSDEPRGTGLRRAVGELVTCPYCLDQWIGAAFVAGLATQPRATRWGAALFAVPAVANALQALYLRIVRSR